MEPKNKMFSSFLLLFSLLSTALTVPLQWESNSCAQSCSSDPLLIRYDQGKTYVYSLDTNTAISYGSESGPDLQSVGIKARVELSVHSPCELSLQLRDVQLQGIQSSDSLFDMKQQLESQPLQFGYSDGVVVGVCPSVEDELWAINVKKSVLSALQMSARSTQTKSIVVESDILGKCETVYEPISRKYATIVIQKSKQLNRCADRQQTQIGLFPRQYGLNQLLQRSSAPITNSSFTCSQTIDKDIVIGATCQEQQLFWPTSILLESAVNLRFEKQIQGLSAKRVQQFTAQRHQLFMGNQKNNKMYSSQSWDESELVSLLRGICSQIQNDVLSPETTESFPQLVEALQYVPQQSIVRVYQSVKNSEICPQSPKVLDLFLDASALASSEGSIQVLVEALQQRGISGTRAAYLFSLLAFSTNPSESVVQQLLPLLQSRDTPRQVFVGISGLIHNLRQSNAYSSGSQPIRQSIDAIVDRIESARNNDNPSELISLLRALENIGIQSHSRAIQVLSALLSNTRQPPNVRVVAIQALTEAANESTRREWLRIFRTQSETNEVRIAAYKAVVLSGPTNQQLLEIRDQIQRENNQNIVNYVRSHQQNLHQTSDPHKRDILPHNAPQFQAPVNQFGTSRNFELSYLHDATQVGVALEADLVYGQQSRAVPRWVTLNATVPVFGRELQVIELQLRQKGLDSVFGQQLQRLSRFTNIQEIVSEIIEIFTQQESALRSGQVDFEANIKIDGKTIFYFNGKDIDFELNVILQQFRQQLQQRIQWDRAFAVIPVNTVIQFPTSNGFPISLRLNSTLVSGIKANLQLDASDLPSNGVFEALLLPSIAVQLEAGVQFQAGNNQRKALEFVSRVSSAPVLDARAQVRDGRIVDVKINLPQNTQSLVRFEARVYQRDQSGQRRVVKGNNSRQQHYKQCTQNGAHALGLSVCSDLSWAKPYGPMNGEIVVKKNDKSMKSFEFSVEMPPKNAEEMKVYRLSVNTPNSEVDREISAEVQFIFPKNGYKKEIKMQFKSPFTKRWNVQGALRLDSQKERAIQMEVTADGQKLVAVDAGVEGQTRGQKREYRPRVRVQIAGKEPVNLQGSVSLSKGRKNQLSIQLEGNQQQLIKGSFVREGDKWGKNNDFRVSSDLTLNLGGNEIRIIGVGDKAQKHMMSDLTVEYKLAQYKRESFKLSAKLQNLTQSQLTKMSAFSELTSTQFPQYNFHLAYNLLKKPFEHIENELTVAWRQQLKDKLHVLQVSKYTNNDNNAEQKVENTILVELTPLQVNYEMRANAVYERQSSNGPKYSVDLVGKDRNGRKDYDVKGQFQYRHVSRAPLHLVMSAQLRTAEREMKYSDELKEMSPNEYNGKTSVQWQSGKSAQLEYNYKIKSDARHTHHEVDAELTTPNSRYPIRHKGLLRLSRNDLHVQSNVNYQGQQLYNLDTLLARNSNSKLALQVKGLQTKVSVSPYTIPQLAEFEIQSDQGLHHKSNVEFVPRSSLAFKSDTKRNSNNVFALDSHISRISPSRVVITSQPFEGRLDLDTISARRSGAFEARAPQQQWSHVSQYSYEPSNRFFSLKSNTESKGKSILGIDSQWSPRENSFLNLELPQRQTLLSLDGNVYGNQRQKQINIEFKNGQNSQLLSHKSSVNWSPNEVKINSKTIKNRQQFADLDYNYNNGLHALTVDSPQYWGQFEGQLSGQPFGKLGLKDKLSQYTHETRITTEPQKVLIESKTQKRAQNIADLNALLSRNYNTESNVNFVTPRVSARLAVSPYSSAKFEVNAPQLDHVTHGQWSTPFSPSDWSINSNTQLNNNYYNFLAKNLPQRRQTIISAKIPAFDSEFQYNRGENPKLKVEFQGKHPQIPYNHVTELESNGKQVSVKSRTDNNSRGNVFSLDGQYNRQYSGQYNGQYNGQYSQSEPSQLNLAFGQHLSANIKVNPFSAQKTLNFEIKKNNAFNHVTDINVNPQQSSLLLKSRTSNSFGQNLANIDSYLAPQTGQRSHLTISTQNNHAHFEIVPQNRAKFEFKNPFLTHESQLQSHDSGNGYAFQSLTTRRGETLLDLNSAINGPHLTSHLNVNAPQLFNSQFSISPNQRTAKLEFQSRNGNIVHKSNVKVTPNVQNGGNRLYVLSKTDYNNRPLVHLDTELSAHDNNRLDLEIPSFASKSELNLLSKKLSVDLRSKLRNGRHVLGSIALNPNSQNGFHADIAWDLDKNPNQRLVLDVSARREGSSGWTSSGQQIVVSMEADYAQNQFKVLAQMNPNDFIYGPHDLTINYVPSENPSRDSVTLKAHHVVENSEWQCKWQYFEGNPQKLKFGAQFNAKIQQNGNQLEASLETQAPKNTDLEYKVRVNARRDSQQYYAEIVANQGVDQQYKVNVDVKQDSRDRVKGVVSVDTPTISGQSVNFELEKSQKQFSLSAVNQNGKQLEVDSGFTENGVHFDLKSNVEQIPSIKANARYVKYRELSFALEKDAQNLVDFSAKLSGNSAFDASGIQFNAKFESKLSPNFEFNSKLMKHSNEIEIQFKTKYDSKELFATQMTANKRQGMWSGEAMVTGHGAELARAQLDSGFVSNSMQYSLRANGQQFAPIVISFESHVNSDSNEKKSSAKVCSGQSATEKCVNVALEYKPNSHNYWKVPEKLMFSLNKMGARVQLQYSLNEQMHVSNKYETSLMDLSSDKKIDKKTKNQFIVGINSHSIGFEIQSTARDNNNAGDSFVKLYFPSNRVMQFRADYKSDQNKHATVKMDFKADAREPQPLFDTKIDFNSNSNEFKANLEINSEKFKRNPKSISFSARKSPSRGTYPSYNTKLLIDVAKNPNNALTIESDFKIDNQNYNNRTLTVSIATRDRRAVDFQTTAHVSSKTAGITWQNVNRNGNRKQGFYFVELLGGNRFQAYIRDSQNELKIDGNYVRNDQELSSDISIIDNNNNRQQTDYRFSAENKCVKFQSKKDQIDNQKVQFCLNTENSKLLSFSAESVDGQNGDKVVDFSLEVDGRAQKAMKIDAKWNPKKVQNILEYLAQNSNENQNSWTGEFSQEFKHKSVLIAKQLTQEFLVPFIEIFTDQFGDLFQEFERNFGQIFYRFQQILEQIYENFQQFLQNLIPSEIFNNIQSRARSLWKNARKQCKYSQTCYRVVYAVENYGWDGIVDVIVNKAIEYASQTHRLVITTSGKLIRSLPSPSTIPFPEFISQYLSQYSEAFKQTIQSIIDSNQDLRTFVQQLRQIFGEILKENFESIDWSRVRQAANQIVDLVFSRSSLASESRVLVWDPKRGEIQVEIRSPVIHSRRLRAVLSSATSSTSMSSHKNDSTPASHVKQMMTKLEQKIKSMFQ